MGSLLNGIACHTFVQQGGPWTFATANSGSRLSQRSKGSRWSDYFGIRKRTMGSLLNGNGIRGFSPSHHRARLFWALQFSEEMQRHGLHPDVVTCTVLISTCDGWYHREGLAAL